MPNREALSARVGSVLNRFFQDAAVVDAVTIVTKDGFPDRIRNFDEIAEKFGSGLPVEIHIFEGEDTTPVRVSRIESDDAEVLAPFARLIGDAIRRIPAVVLEMQLLYAFALYEGAKSDLLKALFSSWPELIGSERTITYREAVQIAEAGGLQDVLAARESQWYTDKGSAEQFRQLERRLSLAPNASSDLRARMSVLHALRNVLIHNSGVVDERYRQAVGGSAPPIGAHVRVTHQDMGDAMKALRDYVLWLARSIAVRYGTGDPLAESGSGLRVLGLAEDGERTPG